MLVCALCAACSPPADSIPPSDDRRGFASGAAGAASDPVDPRCTLPAPASVQDIDDAVLKVWELSAESVYFEPVLPPDSAFLTYRDRIRASGADVRRPASDRPVGGTEAQSRIWDDEEYNNELAQSGAVGSIDPITCLDALLFAHQNGRAPQIEEPAEFLASVLRREFGGRDELVVVFGAGSEMFPPKSVYGLDVVDRYRASDWRFLYALHNHTVQRSGDDLALGSPVLSTSDVQLTRALAANRGLETARVTNGFYTFSVAADELALMRSR